MQLWYYPSGVAAVHRLRAQNYTSFPTLKTQATTSGVPRWHELLTNWLKKSGVSIIPSCSLIHCNNAQNSEKHYNYNFITKDTNLNQPMKRCIVIKVWDNPKPKASVPSGRIILCVHQCISPARRLNQGLVSRIFIGISLWRYDRLPPGTQSPGLLPIPGGLANIIWLKVPTI